MRYENIYASDTCLKRKCGKAAYARSLCRRHYEHLKKYGRSLNDMELIVEHRKQLDMQLVGDCLVVRCSGGSFITDSDKSIVRLLVRRKWSIGKNGYPVTGKVYLHHFLKGKPPTNMVVDHINRDKKDARLSNLRFVTKRQNVWNYTPHGKSGVRGVSWDSQTNSWRVMVGHYRRRFKDKKEAVRVAYEKRVLLYGEDFA